MAINFIVEDMEDEIIISPPSQEMIDYQRNRENEKYLRKIKTKYTHAYAPYTEEELRQEVMQMEYWASLGYGD